MILLQNIMSAPQSTSPTTAEQFVQYDPLGIGMTIIAMSVVFTILFVLYIAFKYIGNAYNLDLKRKILLKKGKIKEAEQITADTHGEIQAAIALAIYLYKNRLHDKENTVLTIQKVARTYSPWSSKIYGLRQTPNR